MTLRLLRLTVLCAGLLATPARAQDSRELGQIVNEYLTGYWAFRPVSAATAAGVHSQDKLLEDWSVAAVQSEIARCHALLDRLQKLDPKRLSVESRADRDRLMSQIRLTLADLETRRSAATRPDRYVLLLAESLWTLTSRQFA